MYCSRVLTQERSKNQYKDIYLFQNSIYWKIVYCLLYWQEWQQ